MAWCRLCWQHGSVLHREPILGERDTKRRGDVLQRKVSALGPSSRPSTARNFSCTSPDHGRLSQKPPWLPMHLAGALFFPLLLCEFVHEHHSLGVCRLTPVTWFAPLCLHAYCCRFATYIHHTDIIYTHASLSLCLRSLLHNSDHPMPPSSGT